MKPDKMEFKIGETQHKQPIKLVYEKDYMTEVAGASKGVWQTKEMILLKFMDCRLKH